MVNHYLDVYRNHLSENVRGVSPEAMRMLIAYDWPGNIRELRNTMESICVYARNELVEIEDLPETIRGGRPAFHVPSQALPEGESLENAEQRWIAQIPEKHHGNKSLAAKELGISRSTLYRKLNA